MKKVLLLILSLGCFCLFCGIPAFAQGGTSKAAKFKPRLIMPVQYYVVVQGTRSKFLAHYCRDTHALLKIRKGIRRAGPFLSAYEAGWLASRIPRARVEKITLFSRLAEPMDIQTLAGLLDGQYDLAEVRVLETGRMKIGDRDLLRIYLEFKDKQKYEALFFEREGQWQKVIEWPWMDDPYQQSFGIAVLETKEAPVFLSLENAWNGTESKSENLLAWRLDTAGDKIPLKSFERFTEFACIWDAKHRGYVDFRCSRISRLKNGIQFRHYDMHLRTAGFDPDQSLKGATSWQIKGPDRDALKIKRIHWPVKENWII